MTNKEFTTSLPTADETKDHANDLLGSVGLTGQYAHNILLARLVHIIEVQTVTQQALLRYLQSGERNTKLKNHSNKT